MRSSRPISRSTAVSSTPPPALCPALDPAPEPSPLPDLSQLAARLARVLAQEACLQQQTERLRLINQAQARFFANLAHEFRTSLTLLIGPLQELVANAPASAARQALLRQHTEMLNQAQRLLRLVGQLLDLSKLEGGCLSLQPTRIDLIPFLDGIGHAFAPLAERKGITLHTVYDRPSIPVDVDPAQLEKVFYNLLGNALKFTEPGGKVALHLRHDAPDAPIEVRVCDTGPGIAPKDQPFIFDRFYQTGNASRPDRTGTGIGLALAKELVELHGGSLRLDSTPGLGSTFIVTLPLRQPASPAPETPHEALEPHAVATRAKVVLPPCPHDTYDPRSLPESSPMPDPAALPILVVDDNPSVRAFLRDLLQTAYRIEEATDGTDGLARIRKRPPALVICDVSMPGMDGYDLLHQLKTHPTTRSIPVLMLTAHADTATQLEAWQSGADGFLLKPFEPQVLRARVDRMIVSRRHLRDQFSREVVLRPTGVVVQPEQAAFLEHARQTVEAHFESEGFDVQALADALGLSRRHLQRRLRETTGQAPRDFIRSLRLERARQLLEQAPGRVADVAYAVGFCSVSHFTQCFRAHFGQTPSAFAASYTSA